jgi:murein DD-endopeptidase MepM/ murein hydrolase activator NlpD
MTSPARTDAPKRHRLRRILLAALVFVVAGLLLPEHPRIPVQGATRSDWHPHSFWFAPWGRSGVHKGIDIFASQGTPAVAAVPGIVVYRGRLGMGGNVVLVLGPKWRLHYYAHLAQSVPVARFVAAGDRVGAVGTSGNAAAKPPHLHYAVLSLVPRPWHWSGATQGWKRMFFVDPSRMLAGSSAR